MECLETNTLDTETTGFVIDNDSKADWAIEKIKEAQAERDRLLALIDEKMHELTDKVASINAKYEQDTSYLTFMLSEYAKTVSLKETKTQKSYKLISGSIVIKKATNKMVPNDDKLTAWLKDNGHKEFIKTTEKPMWGELKASLTVGSNGNIYMAETGEEVDGIVLETTPEQLTIK